MEGKSPNLGPSSPKEPDKAKAIDAFLGSRGQGLHAGEVTPPLKINNQLCPRRRT
jgi:hypothetical protein